MSTIYSFFLSSKNKHLMINMQTEFLYYRHLNLKIFFLIWPLNYLWACFFHFIVISFPPFNHQNSSLQSRWYIDRKRLKYSIREVIFIIKHNIREKFHYIFWNFERWGAERPLPLPGQKVPSLALIGPTRKM